VVLLIIAILPGVTLAQHIYSCHDKSGRMITSDQPIPECATLPMDEKTKAGTLVRQIAAPPTAEQLAAQAAEEKKKREQEDEEREQRRRDDSLLSTYPNEKSIEVARTRALADFVEALKAANERMAGLQHDREVANAEAAPFKGKTLPLSLQHRLDSIDAAVDAETRNIADRNRDVARINARFDADAARYKELEAASSAQAHVKR
jgi:hypothetical protein